MKKRGVVFATGTQTGGGSGFQELVEFSRTKPPLLELEITAVVSNHENGGVKKRADTLNIPFELFKAPWSAERYREIMGKYEAKFALYSGWLKPGRGILGINIHPGLLPFTQGLHQEAVHKKTMELFQVGELKQSAVTMHFAPDYDRVGYDQGPIFFQYPVLIREDDTWETLASRINEKERAWQAFVTNLVVQEKIVYRESDVPHKIIGEKRWVAMTADTFTILRPFLPDPTKIQLIS